MMTLDSSRNTALLTKFIEKNKINSAKVLLLNYAVVLPNHFVMACQNNNLDMIKLLIEAKGVPTIEALNMAAYLNLEEIYNYLLLFVLPNTDTLNNFILNKNLSQVDLIIKSGFIPNSKSLTYAVENNCIKLVDKLLEDIAYSPNDLDCAIKKKYYDIVDILAKHTKINREKCALFLVIAKYDIEAVKICIKYNFIFDDITCKSFIATQHMQELFLLYDYAGDKIHNFLRIGEVVIHKQFQILKSLINYGMDLSFINHDYFLEDEKSEKKTKEDRMNEIYTYINKETKEYYNTLTSNLLESLDKFLLLDIILIVRSYVK